MVQQAEQLALIEAGIVPSPVVLAFHAEVAEQNADTFNRLKQLAEKLNKGAAGTVMVIVKFEGNTKQDMINAVQQEVDRLQADGISLPGLQQKDYTVIVPESLLDEFQDWGRVVAARADMSFAQIFALAAAFKADFIAGAQDKMDSIDTGGRQSFYLASTDASTVEDVDSQIEEALLAEIQY